jgi:hypothetical protein
LVWTHLTLDEDLQPREKIDTRVLEEYAHLLGDGVSFPPVIVFFDGATRWLADGYHRWHAHKALGLVEITVDMRLGNKRDALIYSLGANAEHGKQRVYGDLRKAYEIIKRNELCEPWNASRVHELLKCTPRWAEKLTKRARDKPIREETAAMQAAKAEGKSTREIGLEHGVDHSTVVRRLAGAETNSSEMHHPEQELDLEPPPERRERLGWEWVDWTGPIRRLAELDADP